MELIFPLLNNNPHLPSDIHKNICSIVVYEFFLISHITFSGLASQGLLMDKEIVLVVPPNQ